MFQRSKRGGWPYSQPPNVPFEVNWNSPQAKGLVAWWPIFDSRGRTTDVLDKLKRFDLTQFNTPSWAASGRFGPTLLFDDGANEYAKVDSAVVTAPPFTLMAWVNSDDAAARQAVVGIGEIGGGNHYFSLKLHGDIGGDPVRFTTWDGTAAHATTTTGYSVGTWHHVVGVAIAANSRVAYIDGGGKGTSVTAEAPANIGRTAIATRPTVAAWYFSGLIADVRVYNRAFSDLEVYEAYRRPWELARPLVRRVWALAPAAPPAGAMPMAMDHYRRRRV